MPTTVRELFPRAQRDAKLVVFPPFHVGKSMRIVLRVLRVSCFATVLAAAVVLIIDATARGGVTESVLHPAWQHRGVVAVLVISWLVASLAVFATLLRRMRGSSRTTAATAVMAGLVFTWAASAWVLWSIARPGSSSGGSFVPVTPIPVFNQHAWNSTGSVLVVLATLAVNLGCALMLVRLLILGRWMRDRRTPWRRYGAMRGLRASNAPHPGVLDVPAFADWIATPVEDAAEGLMTPHTLTGQVGRFNVTVGSLVPPAASTRQSLFGQLSVAYVSVTLPRSVARAIPASSFTRPLRESSLVELDLDGASSVTLSDVVPDSGTRQLGDVCMVRIDPQADMAAARAAFDDAAIAALLDTYDVQWQQHGTQLIVACDVTHLTSAPNRLLDTMCLGAAFVAERLVVGAIEAAPAGESELRTA